MKRQTFVEHKLLFVILLSFSFVFAFAGDSTITKFAIA